MANRFIDTNFYKSPFIRGLNGASKGLYSFIICDCKASGIWPKDLEIASLYIGLKVTEKDFDVFIKSGKAIDLNDGNYFFPDFIEHQYPKGLSDTNPAHNNVIKDLKKYNLIDEDLKTLKSPLKGTKVKVTKKVEETETVEETVEEILKTPLEKKFDEFLEYRKQIKKPVVEKSLQPLKNKLWELSNKDTQTAIDILDQTITNGWQGIFEIKNNNNGKQTTNQNQHIRDSIRADFERDLANGFSNPTK